MDIANEIAVYLDGAGFGTLGTDIFVDQIPAQRNGIYIEQIGGGLHRYTPMKDAIVNIYVKNQSAQTAKTAIANISNLVHRMVGTVTTNSYIYSILVIGDTESMGRDLDHNALYKVTVQIKCRDNNLIS